MQELDWNNLKDDNCPKCGTKLFLNKCIKCNFKISQKRKDEIIEGIDNDEKNEPYDDKYFFGE